MGWLRNAAMAVAAITMLVGTAHAESTRPNGDGNGDLAPLGTSGNGATDGPLAHANTPPIGGATQGGGGNPKESGPVDAARTGKPDSKAQVPDNK